MHHWLVACRALEQKIKGFLERKSPTAGRLAAVKLMILLVLKSGFKLFENVQLLGCDEPSKLVGLESPMKYEPARFSVAGPPEGYEGVVV